MSRRELVAFGVLALVCVGWYSGFLKRPVTELIWIAKYQLASDDSVRMEIKKRFIEKSLEDMILEARAKEAVHAQR